MQIRATSDKGIKQTMQGYADERWDAAKLEARVKLAVDWAAKHNVRLICDEFGVYKSFSPAADRRAWHADVRAIFEKYGIGWTMWQFDNSFGLVRRSGDTLKVDQDLARALGLTVKP